VRNCSPPNILRYDHLGNPRYHPICTLSTPVTTASVSVSSPWFPVTPYGTLAMHNHWMIPYHTPVHLASVPFVPPKHLPVCATIQENFKIVCVRLELIELFWT